MTFAIVKLKPETRLNVDFHYEVIGGLDTHWVWLAERRGGYITLRRPGYGTRDEYGSGKAMIRGVEPLIMVTPWCLLESPLLDDIRHWKL